MQQPVSPSSASAVRTFLRRLALVGAAASFFGLPAAGQGETGFVRGQGNADIAATYTFDTYDRFWVGTDKVSMDGVGTIDRAGYTLYAAYGLTDDIDLILNGAYIETSSDGAAGAPDESDLQDLVLGSKIRLLRKETSWGEMSFLVLPGVKLPMTDYENNALTAIGDGNVDWLAHVIGHVQTHSGLFASLETGYDFRVGDPPDVWPIHLTAGGTIANRVTISPFLSYVDSLWGTDIGPPGTNVFPTNEEDYTRTGVSAFVRINSSVGITGNWRTTLDGRNTGDVEGFSLGLVVSL